MTENVKSKRERKIERKKYREKKESFDEYDLRHYTTREVEPVIWNYREVPLEKLGRGKLYASLDRLCDKGVLPEEYRYKISISWTEQNPDAYAFVRWSIPNHIFVHRESYSMWRWALDTIVWHELSHILTGCRGHDKPMFKKMLCKRRGQNIMGGFVQLFNLMGMW